MPEPALVALADSRARWRDLARIGCELAFETDAAGRFAFVGQEEAFGWHAEQLLGLPAADLLVQTEGAVVGNPFRPLRPVRHRRAWLRRADGSTACVLVSASPLLDANGDLAGARGVLQDVTEADRREARLAATLLCRQTMKEIARCMRKAVLPDMVIKIGLDELLDATGGNGALVVACGDALPALFASDLPAPADPAEAGQPELRLLPRILHRAGHPFPATDQALLTHLRQMVTAGPVTGTRSEQQFDVELILSATGTHFCDLVLLVLWRDATRPWAEADLDVADEFLTLLGGVLEHDQVQRELGRQSGADALTTLLNRENFAQEVNRRLDRLDSEGLPATLMLVGLDQFGAVNRKHGHEAGDIALRHAAQVLRAAVRPTDLVARLGGDVFALWLDGADQFAAAERAEIMCQHGVPVMLDEPVRISVSIGLATRPSRSYDSIETLVEEAQAALGAVKLAGGGRWHVYNEGAGA